MPGRPPAPPPGRITGNAYDFQKVFVGATAKGDVTWTNGSNTDVTFVSAGTNGAPFDVDAAAAPAMGAPLRKNGGTLTVKYTFSPTAKGVFNGRANLVVQGGAAQVVRPDLVGEGIYAVNAGVFSVSVPGTPAPEFVDFGRVQIGAAPSPTRTVHVANAAAQAVNAHAATNDPAFAVAPPNPIPLAPGGPTALTVTFAPTQRKVYWAVLLVQDPANPGNHTVIVLTGEGVGGN